MSNAIQIEEMRKRVESAGFRFSHHGEIGKEFYVCVANAKAGRKRFINVTNPTSERLDEAIEFVRKA